MEYLPYGNYYEPQESDPVGYCSECGQDILAGDEICEIKNEWYCERCIDGFYTEVYEKEEYFEEAV